MSNKINSSWKNMSAEISKPGLKFVSEMVWDTKSKIMLLENIGDHTVWMSDNEHLT
jgi:hypothetical protein